MEKGGREQGRAGRPAGGGQARVKTERVEDEHRHIYLGRWRLPKRLMGGPGNRREEEEAKGYGVPSTHPHTCTYTHKHTHKHTHIQTHAHTSIHTHIHTHSHTHKYTHTHPHTHTYTPMPATLASLTFLPASDCPGLSPFVLFNLGPALKGPSRKTEGERWGKQLFKGKLVVRKEPRLTAQRDTAAWEASKTLQEASLHFCPAPHRPCGAHPALLPVLSLQWVVVTPNAPGFSCHT